MAFLDLLNTFEKHSLVLLLMVTYIHWRTSREWSWVDWCIRTACTM